MTDQASWIMPSEARSDRYISAMTDRRPRTRGGHPLVYAVAPTTFTCTERWGAIRERLQRGVLNGARVVALQDVLTDVTDYSPDVFLRILAQVDGLLVCADRRGRIGPVAHAEMKAAIRRGLPVLVRHVGNLAPVVECRIRPLGAGGAILRTPVRSSEYVRPATMPATLRAMGITGTHSAPSRRSTAPAATFLYGGAK